MLDPATLTQEERDIYDTELAQLSGYGLKGSRDAVASAIRAVERHRQLRCGKMKVGQGGIEDRHNDRRFSDTTFPSNAEELRQQCIDKICLLRGAPHAAFKTHRGIRNWVVIALSTSVGEPSARKILGMSKGMVTVAARGLPESWVTEAKAFGATLKPVYPVKEV
jgi:hypothetical protein